MTDASLTVAVSGDEPAIVTDSQTGRQFVSPYRYERQFETEFDTATLRMVRDHGTRTERFAWAVIPIMGGCAWLGFRWLGWAINFFVADPSIAKWLTRFIIGAWIGMMALLLVWALRGKKRFRRRLVEQRLCFTCGYALIGQTLDEHGMGRCPECGERFDVRRYLRPPKRYHDVKPRRGGSAG